MKSCRYHLPKESVLLVTDNGDKLSIDLANELNEKGLNVCFVKLDTDKVSPREGLNKEIVTWTLGEHTDAAIEILINKIEKHSKIGGLIHVHPNHSQRNMSEKSAEVLKTVFFMAKALKRKWIKQLFLTDLL